MYRKQPFPTPPRVNIRVGLTTVHLSCDGTDEFPPPGAVCHVRARHVAPCGPPVAIFRVPATFASSSESLGSNSSIRGRSVNGIRATLAADEAGYFDVVRNRFAVPVETSYGGGVKDEPHPGPFLVRCADSFGAA